MSDKYPGGFVTITTPTGAAGFNPALGAAAPGVWTLDEAEYYQGNRLWPIYDPNFSGTTLLLHGNQPSGVTDTSNNVFKDSSTNNSTITRNGNTTQGTFTPFSQTGWGNYFNGSSYLSLASNVALQMASGDFTIETWFYATNATNVTQRLITTTVGAFGSTDFGLRLESGTTQHVRALIGGVSIEPTSPTISGGQWYHIAVVRSGSGTNNCTIYLNGLNIGQGTSTANISTAIQYIGGYFSTGPAEYFSGYLSNTRVIKGAALYTANFTPSTVPLTTTVSAGTVSLLTCQSNRFIDNSANAFTITPSGSPQIQAFSPFYPTAPYNPTTIGGSGYFNGTTDYLTVPYNIALAPASGDFTVEAWIYYTTAPGTNNTAIIGNINQSTGNGDWVLFYRGGSTRFEFACSSSGAVAGLQRSFYTITPVAGTWYHIAGVKSGSTLSCYVNGVKGTDATLATVNNGSLTTYIGTGTDLSGYLVGYMSGLRVLKGTAATITVPTSPPTNITNTSLLLNYTNAAVIDNTAKNDLVTVGNAVVSTTQSKWGGASIYIPTTGATDYCLVPYKNANFPDVYAGGGNFTVEAWVYVTAYATNQNTICGTRLNGAAGWEFRINSTGTVSFYYTGGTVAVTTSTVSLNTWTHVAAVKNNGTTTVYINGVSGGSAAQATATATTNAMYIGSGVGANSGFSGYIDDLRITQGVARYTGNFTPPTSQLQDQ